ncbi:atpH [Symbiodinium pilosum]|uniref:AtpH protein n=1 Tax=Symbiodinium pilosum TaxID=2952 RepID=A0A812KLG2_SYMPI|nr:atpH [Symbiodinium pilosum]
MQRRRPGGLNPTLLDGSPRNAAGEYAACMGLADGADAQAAMHADGVAWKERGNLGMSPKRRSAQSRSQNPLCWNGSRSGSFAAAANERATEHGLWPGQLRVATQPENSFRPQPDTAAATTGSKALQEVEIVRKTTVFELESKVADLGVVCSKSGTEASVAIFLKEFEWAIQKSGIEPESKAAAFEAVCSNAIDTSALNFLKVLVENKRTHLPPRMMDIFENLCQSEKNSVRCKVTSAATLPDATKSRVQAAMQKRAEGSKLFMETHDTNTALRSGCEDQRGLTTLSHHA